MVQSLLYETVSSSDKPAVTNQSGSTSVDTFQLKTSLPGPFSFLSRFFPVLGPPVYYDHSEGGEEVCGSMEERAADCLEVAGVASKSR